MTKLPRGSYQFAVNREYNMSMHCWHDKNPVHVLSTADSTQFNKLMSLFSLAQAHAFTKYYKKIAMVLMDFVLVNSYLHLKLWVNDKFKNS